MANKIIKILGPSGAGKTTLVRGIMSRFDVEPIQACGGPGTKLKTIGYLIDAPTCIYVPGSYEANCGGVDTIDSAQAVMDDIDEMYGQNHVIFEGLLQSTYYGKMGEWSKKYGDNFIYAWLNTPRDLAMARLILRRKEQGTTRELNIPQAEAKYDSVIAAFNKARNNGHVCVELKWDEDPVAQVLELLK